MIILLYFQLRDCELGATLNRELKQRVRPVNGITAHKQIVQSDIKLAAKIMQNLDTKWRMWEEDPEEKKDDTKEVPCDMVQIRNPILKNVTDFLIDEGDFEEEELLGIVKPVLTIKEKTTGANNQVVFLIIGSIKIKSTTEGPKIYGLCLMKIVFYVCFTVLL